MCFRTYRQRKDCLDKFLKSPVLENRFTDNQLKCENIVKSAWQHFYHISNHSDRWSWKVSLLVTCEILGLFVNALTADTKFFLRNGENLCQPFQMQLSKT